MRLRQVHIVSAPSCDGLLDGLRVNLYRSPAEGAAFRPLCLVGPNGSGKSQFLQVLAEIFQSAWHFVDEKAERAESNPKLLFEVEYSIKPDGYKDPVDVRLSRLRQGSKKNPLKIELRQGNEWKVYSPADQVARQFLPSLVVGYTSGGNETLSVPFFVSRAGYAKDVREKALKKMAPGERITNPRLMFIDFGTHLEVLAANLILGSNAQRSALLRDADLKDLHSLRCVIQLARRANAKVRLTPELRQAQGLLRRCATCWSFDEAKQTLELDFHIDSAIRRAFKTFWVTALNLYTVLHKLALLNDLAISKPARTRFEREIESRRFASRLPEPQDEEKIFRFEQVRFRRRHGKGVIDYIALSDGEHQLAQVLGTMCMVSEPNVLFLMDEPESHFNPDWRVKFTKNVMNLPTAGGTRLSEKSSSAQQEALITTHSPFMPSDLPHEQVLLFSKTKKGVEVKRPEIETYGATFNTIVEHCFAVQPPISDTAKDEIQQLMKSKDVPRIEKALNRFGGSVQKVILMDHLGQLKKSRRR